jgi:hypothetical protein
VQPSKHQAQSFHFMSRAWWARSRTFGFGLAVASVFAWWLVHRWLWQAGGFSVLALTMLIFGLVYVLLAYSPTTITLHDDGLSIRWLGRRRFVPYERLAAVEQWQDILDVTDNESQRVQAWDVQQGVRILLRDGKTLRLRTRTWRMDPLASGLRVKMALPDPLGNGFVRAVKQRSHACTGVTLAPHPAGLERGGRSVAEWLAELRALGMVREGGYRATPSDRGRLLRIAEDAAESAPLRIAAAVALAGSLDDHERGRLRVAHSESGSPRFHAAMEAVLDVGCDDATLHRVLQESEES